MDASLLLCAEDILFDHHDEARTWWDGHSSGVERVALCWPVVEPALVVRAAVGEPVVVLRLVRELRVAGAEV